MFCGEKENDNYTTCKDGWKLIKNMIPKDYIIYSPFYSDGKMKSYFKELGFDIIHNDEDFFQNYDKYEYDIIIDNIPFSKRRKIFETLKKIDKPFMILCLSNLLSCKWFYSLFDDDLQIIIPTKRVKFFNIKTPGKSNYTPPRGSFFYCYKMKFKKDITFL